MGKIHFWDVGVRNTLIQDLRFPTERQDVGQLWENFVIAERQKLLRYTGVNGPIYFWRTHNGPEIDLVEDRDGELTAFECKWAKGEARIPLAFRQAYPNARFHTITPDNYTAYLT